MKAHFFDVCEFFQKAGYHVVWLMRCVQDVEGGYLKLVKMEDGGARCRWKWRKPTTNFGRWTSDNYSVSILIQHRQVPPDVPKAELEELGEGKSRRAAEQEAAGRMLEKVKAKFPYSKKKQ